MRPALILILTFLAGCADSTPSPAPETSSLRLATPPPVAPIAFFERACANCHGPLGMFYGDGFAQLKSDDDLIRAVRDMVTGPAQSTLDDRSLDALTAFHRWLAGKASGPFVVITTATDDTIGGECSPDTTVELILGTRTITAATDHTAWSAQLPADWRASPTVYLRASAAPGEPHSTIDLTRASFSHAQP